MDPSCHQPAVMQHETSVSAASSRTPLGRSAGACDDACLRTECSKFGLHGLPTGQFATSRGFGGERLAGEAFPRAQPCCRWCLAGKSADAIAIEAQQRQHQRCHRAGEAACAGHPTNPVRPAGPGRQLCQMRFTLRQEWNVSRVETAVRKERSVV
eukprot:366000-Chlamydomonas_euryale.AAC.16